MDAGTTSAAPPAAPRKATRSPAGRRNARALIARSGAAGTRVSPGRSQKGNQRRRVETSFGSAVTSRSLSQRRVPAEYGGLVEDGDEGLVAHRLLAVEVESRPARGAGGERPFLLRREADAASRAQQAFGRHCRGILASTRGAGRGRCSCIGPAEKTVTVATGTGQPGLAPGSVRAHDSYRSGRSNRGPLARCSPGSVRGRRAPRRGRDGRGLPRPRHPPRSRRRAQDAAGRPGATPSVACGSSARRGGRLPVSPGLVTLYRRGGRAGPLHGHGAHRGRDPRGDPRRAVAESKGVLRIAARPRSSRRRHERDPPPRYQAGQPDGGAGRENEGAGLRPREGGPRRSRRDAGRGESPAKSLAHGRTGSRWSAPTQYMSPEQVEREEGRRPGPGHLLPRHRLLRAPRGRAAVQGQLGDLGARLGAARHAASARRGEPGGAAGPRARSSCAAWRRTRPGATSRRGSCATTSTPCGSGPRRSRHRSSPRSTRRRRRPAAPSRCCRSST